MARAALTTVPTSISQHVRRTASGEVVPVGGYRAGRLKDLGSQASEHGDVLAGT